MTRQPRRASPSPRTQISTQRRKAWATLKASLNTLPDSIDIRDWVYQPSLMPVPPSLVNCHRVPEILDQGNEGACTGFALAAVANFLLHSQGQKRRVSPRMLYELARRYDEWPGEWYEGSSARGAMKGWLRHGVANRSLWRDDQHGANHMTQDVVRDAMQCPGGAYYRVNHRQVRDMHAALTEVGILYATLMVHDGWMEPGPRTISVPYVRNGRQARLKLPIITRQGQADSGHAVAIVGYGEHGFIIQNSWGVGWGANGFALLPYEDYMLHATDVWVAQLGVPVSVDVWAQEEKRDASVSEGAARALPALTLDSLRPYVIDVGNNGELSRNGDYWTTPEDLRRLVTQDIPQTTQDWKKRRVMLYLHGGLNSEKDAAKRIAAMRGPCLANEIYPLHVMWETGFMESLASYFGDWSSHADKLSGRSLLDSVGEGRDWMIERSLAFPLRKLWGEMKENARLASDHSQGQGAMQLLAQDIRAAGKEKGKDWELHVVAHSAGSIFFAYMLRHVLDLQLPLRSVQFLAPAVTVEVFREKVFQHAQAGACPMPILYLLSGEAELADTVGGQLVYGKSLLYLVSNACEEKRGTPILGMLRFLEENKGMYAAYQAADARGLPQLIITGAQQEEPEHARTSSRSSSHGGFDNDVATMNSVLYRILGNAPLRPFNARDLAYG
ncbi:MAG TPA: C1 family peptidase [Thiobacillaceae bacterium]|nr:C1 family peptidase [Thiobacillaceae bacterium]HNU63337.1 C1 family peptidase [Thiobacillaceae bacterium]